MQYPTIPFQQLHSVPDGELISMIGTYHRTLTGSYLQAGEQRLPLLGEPFSWIPPQQERVKAWGQFLQGRRSRLLLHDIGTVDSEPEAPLPPPAHIGDEMLITAKVSNIGDQQIAVTSNHFSVILIGEELDERMYILFGPLVSLNPPTLQFRQATPVRMDTPALKLNGA